MLILTRKKGEKIMIGDTISIMVMGVKGNQIRIGIDAPQGVSVHREEIYHVIHSGTASKQGYLPQLITYKPTH